MTYTADIPPTIPIGTAVRAKRTIYTPHHNIPYWSPGEVTYLSELRPEFIVVLWFDLQMPIAVREGDIEVAT